MSDEDCFIDGIYNYCDHWCERCPFTARCRLYEMDQEMGDGAVEDDAPLRDRGNAAFWESLHATLQQTREMLTEMAREQGLDLDSLEPDPEYEARREAREKRIDESPLVASAHDYHRKTDEWFQERQDRFEEKEDELRHEFVIELAGSDPEGEAVRIGDAIDVIQWYEYQIAVKLSRVAGQDLDDDLILDEDEVEDAVQNDVNGSAKVALIGIDRSLAAWAVLREAFPDDDDSILDILVHLGRLRTAVEREFPQARRFVRPGFDTELPAAGR